MTISDLGSIANLLAVIGVLVTLIYLSRQVRQGNLLAKFVRHRVAAGAAQLWWGAGDQTGTAGGKTRSIPGIHAKGSQG